MPTYVDGHALLLADFPEYDLDAGAVVGGLIVYSEIDYAPINFWLDHTVAAKFGSTVACLGGRFNGERSMWRPLSPLEALASVAGID